MGDGSSEAASGSCRRRAARLAGAILGRPGEVRLDLRRDGRCPSMPFRMSRTRRLLVLYANGDPAAARALTLRLTPRVLGFAARMLGDRAEAEDVAQEAMLRLWRIAPEWRQGEAKVSTWLYRVASNLCTDRLRASAASSRWTRCRRSDDGAPGVVTRLIEADRTLALEAGPGRPAGPAAAGGGAAASRRARQSRDCRGDGHRGGSGRKSGRAGQTGADGAAVRAAGRPWDMRTRADMPDIDLDDLFARAREAAALPARP